MALPLPPQALSRKGQMKSSLCVCEDVGEWWVGKLSQLPRHHSAIAGRPHPRCGSHPQPVYAL